MYVCFDALRELSRRGVEPTEALRRVTEMLELVEFGFVYIGFSCSRIDASVVDSDTAEHISSIASALGQRLNIDPQKLVDIMMFLLLGSVLRESGAWEPKYIRLG